ncbi:MAG: hypothetical protein BWY79_01626 [Actinobacteria bacterium ADurb.Bin444]|nr:MAG: hypothetical protein BWY79_01626 [Actinobacteria bacterium ADurb.Bin444]
MWINGTTEIGGATWYNAVSQYVGAEEQSLVYVRHTPQGLVSRAEVSDPGYYLLRPPLVVGTTWTDTFRDYIRLTITAVNQTVTVPAGVFTQCIVVDDVATEEGEPTTTIRSWYAYGVGMVQDEYYEGATLQDERTLTEYTLAE